MRISGASHNDCTSGNRGAIVFDSRSIERRISIAAPRGLSSVARDNSGNDGGGDFGCRGYRLQTFGFDKGENLAKYAAAAPALNTPKVEGWDIAAMESSFSSLETLQTTRQ
jgi:hypothetical protein